MNIELKGQIVAVVTTQPERVDGSTLVIHAQDEKEMEQIALTVAKTTMGMVHDLGGGTYIIVRH